MKTIIYILLSFALSAALYRFNVNDRTLLECFLAGFAIVWMAWVGVRSLKTGGKKGDIAY